MGIFKTRFFLKTNRKSLLSFRDVMGVAKSFGLQRSESDFTAHRLEIRNSANYQDFSCDFLRPFFFFNSHAASTIRTNVDICFMVECHIATCPDDHMAV